jgi:hypothetical protein
VDKGNQEELRHGVNEESVLETAEKMAERRLPKLALGIDDPFQERFELGAINRIKRGSCVPL